MSQSRALKWEFFLTRWGMLYDAVAGALGSQTAKQGGAQLTKLDAAKLDVVLQKAVRAKEVLQQLRTFDQRQAQLQARFGPLVAQLPELRAQLDPQQLGALAEFAATQGVRQPVMQVTGKAQPPAAQLLDPFGIRVAYTPGHPLALMGWRQYLATLKKVSAAAETLLSGPRLEELRRFNVERRALLLEMRSLQAQLADEVQLPGLEPLEQEAEQLEDLVQGLQSVQEAHVLMLARDLSELHLDHLELRLRAREGPDAWAASRLVPAIARLKRLRDAAAGGAGLPAAAWEHLETDLGLLAETVQARHAQQVGDAVDINVQRFQAETFARLRQTGSGQQQRRRM